VANVEGRLWIGDELDLEAKVLDRQSSELCAITRR